MRETSWARQSNRPGSNESVRTIANKDQNNGCDNPKRGKFPASPRVSESKSRGGVHHDDRASKFCDEQKSYPADQNPDDQGCSAEYLQCNDGVGKPFRQA